MLDTTDADDKMPAALDADDDDAVPDSMPDPHLYETLTAATKVPHFSFIDSTTLPIAKGNSDFDPKSMHFLIALDEIANTRLRDDFGMYHGGV